MVVIEGSKFTAVGKKGQVNIPKGDNLEVIDTTGKTVLPGLIETHIHSCMVPCAPNHFGTGLVTLNKLEMLTRAIPACRPLGKWDLRPLGTVVPLGLV